MAIKFSNSGGSFSWPQGTGPGTAPHDPLHWRKRGSKLRLAGDRKGAATAYLRYLEAPTRVPQLHSAMVAMERGELPAAEHVLRQYLKANGDDPLAVRMLGHIAFRTEFFAQAEKLFAQIVALVPDYAPARFDLAHALLGQGKAQEALTEARHLIKSDPHNLAFQATEAEALGRVGEFAAAHAVYIKLIEKQPDHAHLWIAHGQILRTLRRGDEAIAAFRRAVALKPSLGEAWWNLANMKTGALTADDAEQIRATLASNEPVGDDLYHLRFALARALEEQGDFAESFAEYKRANAARAARLPARSAPAPTARIKRGIALMTREFMAAHGGQGDPSPAPIFVIGMPRSGSTLLEQILSTHPMIEGTQELADIPITAERLDRGADGKGVNAYPEILGTLGGDRLRALGSEYLDRAGTKRKTGRPFFLDKQPINWRHVGLIQLILPNAKIIEMRRDPLACCLSMFRQHFARGASFSYSIERLAEEYRAYDMLMTHFAEVAPGRILRMELSALQDDLEGQIHRALDYIGVPFAPECLRFFESDRAVFTPSSEQVRRPINRDGDAVFSRFAPHINELRDALSDLLR